MSNELIKLFPFFYHRKLLYPGPTIWINNIGCTILTKSPTVIASNQTDGKWIPIPMEKGPYSFQGRMNTKTFSKSKFSFAHWLILSRFLVYFQECRVLKTTTSSIQFLIFVICFRIVKVLFTFTILFPVFLLHDKNPLWIIIHMYSYIHLVQFYHQSFFFNCNIKDIFSSDSKEIQQRLGLKLDLETSMMF